MPNQANGPEQRGWVSRIIPILLFSDNWLSRIGIVLVTSATVFWLWMLGQGGTGAGYAGILQFVLLPVAFFVGLALIPAGVALDRRQRPKDAPGVAFSWKSEAAKKLLLFVGSVTIINVILGGAFSYQAVHYMEGNEFCGTACHSVMSPEFTAYKNTASHSHVECVACHVGPGATNFVQANLNGTRQLWMITTGKYARPIPEPVDRMHDTKEICGTCHSTSIDSPDKLRVVSKFSDDNQLTKTVLMMKIGGANSGKGIHGAHVGGGVNIRYASTAPRRILLGALGAHDASGAAALLLVRAQHGVGAHAVRVVVEPYLRLRDVRRHLADDARHVLVEDVRLDTGMREPIDQQIGLDAMCRNEDPLHRRPRPLGRSERSAASTCRPGRRFA